MEAGTTHSLHNGEDIDVIGGVYALSNDVFRYLQEVMAVSAGALSIVARRVDGSSYQSHGIGSHTRELTSSACALHSYRSF